YMFDVFRGLHALLLKKCANIMGSDCRTSSHFYLKIIISNLFSFSRMKFLPLFSLVLLYTFISPANAREPALPLDKIQLPPGFSISVWANVPDARAMALGDKGTVFVSS